MNVKEIIKSVVPKRAITYIRRRKEDRLKSRIAALPAVSEKEFTDILSGRLELKDGDTVFVHSSIDKVNLQFPFYRVIALLRSVIGAKGTMLFPTYPRLTSYRFLKSGEVFDIRKTPSYTGVLTEFARRQRDAMRSLHPTKSVCAIGPLAGDLTATHQDSPYPYDKCSPYYKLIDCNAKIVGLGAPTNYLSFVHAVDDALKEEFPVNPYHEELFDAVCVNAEGEQVTVRTYAHDLGKMGHDIPGYIQAEYIR